MTTAAAAAASHTYRTVTLTRYTLNYATLPDDPQLCRGPRSGKKNRFQNHHHSLLNIIVIIIFFFSLGGDFRVGLCRIPVITQRHRIVIIQYTIILLSAVHDGRASVQVRR